MKKIAVSHKQILKMLKNKANLTVFMKKMIMMIFYQMKKRKRIKTGFNREMQILKRQTHLMTP